MQRELYYGDLGGEEETMMTDGAEPGDFGAECPVPDEDIPETFEDYGLRREVLRALGDRGFDSPMPVQRSVLDAEWQGRDMIVRAKTGSGKTLAFLLPLLEGIRAGERSPRALVLAPTRELAQQTAGEAEQLVKYMNISAVSLVGGLEMGPQIRALRSGPAIVVGTPGRVRDHIERGTFETDGIQHVILDEGDLMLDMGFREELEGILSSMPEDRQTWLFSATMPDEVRALADRYIDDPLVLSLAADGEQHEDIMHRVYLIPQRRRFEGLVNILLWEHPSRCLVFCHTKMESIETAQRLQDEGFNAAALQGDMTQKEREAVLASFRSGSVPCLVATNVAARGLDVEGVTHVIQLGLPDDQETFIHRSGRTGRAGSEGTNIILLSDSEAGRFKGMLRRTRMKVEWLDVPGLESIRTIQRDVTERNLLTPSDGRGAEDCVAWAEDLLSRAEPKFLVARLLETLTARSSSGYDLSTELNRERERRKRTMKRGAQQQFGGRRGDFGSTADRGRHDGRRPRGVMTSIRSTRGPVRDVGRVLNALCTSLSVDRGEVGAIRLMDDRVLVELMPLALSRLEKSKNALANWGFSPDYSQGGAKRDTRRPESHERIRREGANRVRTGDFRRARSGLPAHKS